MERRATGAPEPLLSAAGAPYNYSNLVIIFPSVFAHRQQLWHFLAYARGAAQVFIDTVVPSTTGLQPGPARAPAVTRMKTDELIGFGVVDDAPPPRKRHLLVDGTALESVSAGASFVLNPPNRQGEPVLQPDWELAPGCGLC